MTPERIKEVIARARQDAVAKKAGWPVRGCPYTDAESATLWCHELAVALKEGKR
jgi:hypothetical protein